MKDLLIEIGTEELPPSSIETALSFISDRLKEALEVEKVETFATPRRLVFFVKNLENTPKEEEEVVFGPPWKIAFTPEGKPTKALEGFLRRFSATPEEVFKARKGEGEYVALKIRKDLGTPLDRLKENFENILLSVPFKKRMRWTSSKRITFVRPIRWIVALYGEELVDLKFGNIKSSRKTNLHRILAGSPVEVKNPEDYFQKVRKGFVILDHRERKDKIRQDLQEVARNLGAEPYYPEGLLDEVTFLLEYPFPVLGSFEDKFLDLPDLVIVTVCAHHQRFFCFKKDGKILNKFLGFSNNEPKDDTIQRGYERVVKARLEDALFFYREDLKRPLESLVPDLKNVLFHPKIGSLLDKVKALESIATKICSKVGCLEEELSKVKRAVYLSKADILTNMVAELDELQGYMGYVYALEQGEDKEVALALWEQYRPLSEDDLPTTLTGWILAVADKVYDLIYFFKAGEVPKGSSDPYGLRRSAFGLFRLLEAKSCNLDLSEFFPKDMQNQDKLRDFLGQRLESYLEDEGYDLVRAVLEVVPSFRPYEVISRVRYLRSVKGSEDFSKVYELYRRVAKILPANWEGTKVEESKFEAPSERELWEVIKTLESKENLSLEDLVSLKDPVDKLFEEVMIMDKREEIRKNRLALVKRVKDLLLRVADFSKVVL